MYILSYTRFLYQQHFYKQRQTEIGKKIKEILSNTLRLKIIHVLLQRFHPKVIGHILKSEQKNKCVFVRLNMMKMTMKMKNRSRRYDRNRPRCRHGCKYSKYTLSQYDDAYMYQAAPKQHLKLIQDKVKQHRS